MKVNNREIMKKVNQEFGDSFFFLNQTNKFTPFCDETKKQLN